jgi:hypothetical protein
VGAQGGFDRLLDLEQLLQPELHGTRQLAAFIPVDRL